MRWTPGGAALAFCVLLAGCLKDQRTIKLNPDGSGTITVTSTMKAAALEQIRGMARAFGTPEGKTDDLFSEEQVRKKASQMGEGVELVSLEKVKTEAEEGIKAVYSFKDITKLKLSDEPEAPGTPGMIQGVPGIPRPAKKDPITFRYVRTPGGNSVLTVVSPVDKEIQETLKKEEKEGEGKEGKEEEEEATDAQLAAMKEFIGGFRISIQIEIPGKIVKTNTPHVVGSTVTLLEMDLDRMFGDLAKLKKLAKANPKSVEEAKKLVGDFPGVKVCPEPEITIEFKPN